MAKRTKIGQSSGQSKKDRILELWPQHKSTRAVADQCDCHPAYVRVVVRQRKAKGHSAIDIRYLASPKGIAKRKRENACPGHRKYLDAKAKVLMATGDQQLARAAGREAAARARHEGLGKLAQNAAYMRAFRKVLQDTADLERANAAGRRARRRLSKERRSSKEIV